MGNELEEAFRKLDEALADIKREAEKLADENALESLTCPALIEADVLRDLLEKARKNAFRTWPEGPFA